MNITVLNKGNVPTGPFTRAQVIEKLRTGEFSPGDLAFTEGLTQWTTLRDILAAAEPGIPATPQPAPASYTPPPVAAPQPSAAYSYAVTMQPPGHLVYGGFWLRFAAHLLDSIFLTIPILVVLLVIGLIIVISASLGTSLGNNPSPVVMGVFLPVGILLLEFMIFLGFTVLTWLYYALLESSPQQATYGKRIMGLKVTGMTGERITFARATGRFFAKMMNGLIPFAIGYIMAGLTERKQALHDFVAGTLVIRG
ncbi:MAG: RDD family protein [Methylacidiphilales bacterium]|nr:RDD family protein [Candidatus Methylacidiphilales bacterium]